MRKPVIAIALIVLAMSAGPGAQAFHDSQTPTLATGAMNSTGWASIAFTTNGAKVVADIEATNVRYPMQAAAYIYDAKDELFAWFTFTVLAPDTGFYVDLNPPPGLNVRVNELEAAPGGQFMKMGLTLNDPSVLMRELNGDFSMLLFMAGKAARMTWSFGGKSGTTFQRSVTGNDTFLYTSNDFTGVGNVQAGSTGFSARATVATAKTVYAERTFIGEFSQTFGGTDAMTVDRPGGEIGVCPCFYQTFTSEARGEPWGPGAYTFRNTGVGGGADGTGEILLIGADARLP